MMGRSGAKRTSSAEEEKRIGAAGKELEMKIEAATMDTPKFSPPSIELELVLLRHGHTQWNKERRYLGSSDLPLLAEEREKLAALRGQPALAGSFWRVYCSDLLRCRETLASVAPQLEDAAIYDSRLRELSFGAWEGCTYEQLQHHPEYRSWIDDPAAVTPPEGESWGDFAARLEQFVEELVQRAGEEWTAVVRNHGSVRQADSPEAGAGADEAPSPAAGECRAGPKPLKLRVLIVTHGGVIRHWLANARSRRNFHTTAAPPPGTAAVVRLLGPEGGWVWEEGER